MFTRDSLRAEIQGQEEFSARILQLRPRNPATLAEPIPAVISLNWLFTMTQIITAITKEYALLVADRRLTFLEGPQKGKPKDDDTCKLVSLCNVCGIGYTGLAHIEEVPTYEWMAKTLAAEKCSDPATASRILSERASIALAKFDVTLRQLTFVIAGWAHFEGLNGLRPHVCAITNMIDSSGKYLQQTTDTFNVSIKALRDNEQYVVREFGQPLLPERRQTLERNIRKLVEREISPKAALRLLVDEVINSSGHFRTVGKKILALCIPRKAVEKRIQTGRSVMLAIQPNDEAASFCYFDPTYNELLQFGPAMVCGESAAGESRSEKDPTRDYQSLEVRILALPKNETQSEDATVPIFKKPTSDRPIIGFEFGVSVDNIVRRGSTYTIPAAIKNIGDLPIVFAPDLNDRIGQEVLPSMQGGAVPAISFCWPMGAWTIQNFEPVSRTLFAGVALPPGQIFAFNFGSFTAPNAAIGSWSRSAVVDFSIWFTDTIVGQFLNIKGAGFCFPTNVGHTLRFRIGRKSISSGLSFRPARVVDTATGELISGPVSGSMPTNASARCTDTSISTGNPGVGLERGI